ncbi:glycine cleavage system protein T [Candidatus Fermentibacteria bacterium]|nr:MAG: glycine cleavage system protein T [Candidatus Fermentibacteria bacterium]
MDKRTPLHTKHEGLGATIQPFAGYLMPIKYDTIKKEHMAVRDSVGVFDLTHMGEFRVTGAGATAFLDNLLTNDAQVAPGRAYYSAMCYPDGGIVDDLIVYKISEEEYLMVVNAANLEKDWAWVQSHLEGFDVNVADESDETALVAVQGPKAQDVCAKLTDSDLDSIGYYEHTGGTFAGAKALIARTGYTGEDGFEIYVGNADAEKVWDAVMEAGKPFDIVPAGLGARDTLRLEVGYPLYGNDIDHTTTPVEAKLAWVLKLKTDKDFIGREAIEMQKAEKPGKYLAGMIVTGRGFPRQGTPVFQGDRKVGIITSGSIAPALGTGICLGYIERGFHKLHSELEAEVRGKRIPVTVVKVPFYKDGSRK